MEPAEKPAFQRVYQDSDGNGVFRRGVDTSFSEVQTGCIAYHPAHNHLHFQDFANYVLARVADGAVVASSYKVTFCIIDSRRFFTALLSSPGSGYYRLQRADAGHLGRLGRRVSTGSPTSRS